MGKQRRAVDALKKRQDKSLRAAKMWLMTPNQIAKSFRDVSDGFLLSKEWRDLRKLAAEKYGCVCCKCGTEQTARRRINFDHIKPRKFFPELALDIENLQPLCGRCNKNKGNGAPVDYRISAAHVVHPEQWHAYSETFLNGLARFK